MNQNASKNENRLVRILGLTVAEMKILKAVQHIEKSMSEISDDTGIPHSSIPYIVRRLSRRLLLKQVGDGHKNTFWKSDIKSISDSMQNLGKNSIEIYRGREEIFTIFEELANLPKNSRLLAFQPDKSIRQALRSVSVPDWLRIDNAIKYKKFIVEGVVHEKSVNTIIREVGDKNARKIYNSFIGRLEDYVKIPDEFADVESELYLFNNSAFLINWKAEIAIAIRDSEIVALLKVVFTCLKESGTRYSQNEKMRQYKNAIDGRSNRERYGQINLQSILSDQSLRSVKHK